MCSNLFFVVEIAKLRDGGGKILITEVSKVTIATGA
jgi:uncharacterized protein YodC (DUF2158 family)